MSHTHDAEAWNGEQGKRWAASADLMDRILSPVNQEILSAAALGAGERAVDIGCGAGALTFAAAELVGPTGAALGVDVSAPLVEAARQRAAATGSGAEFMLADAAQWRADAPMDAAISRFGVMFFADPASAFANIRANMKPGGRMVFACWRQPEEAELLSLPMKAVTPFFKEAPPRPEPNMPGPFGLADAERTVSLLAKSGWKEIKVEGRDLTLTLTADDKDAFFDRTPIPDLIREQNLEEAPIRAAYRAALERVELVNGDVPLKSGIWRVSARA